MSALSDRLQQAKGQRSIDDIAAQARRLGHPIDRSAVAKFLAGQAGPRPRPSTLEALAAGFGVDVRELRLLAGQPPGEAGPYVPTPESASLTREQRRAIDQLIKAIVRGNAPALETSEVQTRPHRLPQIQAEAARRPDGD